MEFTATPSDVVNVVEAAKKLDANPLKLGGRFLGLGAEDQERGVPLWAWLVLAAAVGGWATVQLSKKLRGRRRRR